jgi:beta-mannosidase
VLAQRNYACDSQVEAFFGKTDFGASGEDAFRAQLHKCVMASTLWLKGQIEIQRGSNSFGSLVWQLNENWPTGGWGLIEYGSAFGQKGQSIGGRWKPTMHLLKQSLFQDVFATCGQRQECYVLNDSNDHLAFLSIVLENFHLASGNLMNTFIIELPLLPGDGHIGM